MSKHICETPECGAEIPEGRGTQGGLPVCDSCRSAQYYARKQGAAWAQDRLGRLHFWSSRLDYLLPHIARRVAEAKQRASTARKRAETRAATH